MRIRSSWLWTGLTAAWLLAALATLLRGWTGLRFASALTVAGMVTTAGSGVMFLGAGPRMVNSRMQAREDILTRGRLPEGQDRTDWLHGRPVKLRAFLIASFLASVATLAAGIALGFAYAT